MSLGNALGVRVNLPEDELFSLGYGSMLVEASGELDYPTAILLGEVTG